MPLIINNGTGRAGWHRAPVSAGHVVLSDKSDDAASSLTPDMVLAKIQSVYMSGLKRCYTTELSRDPKAHGKLELQLSVGADGHVSDAHATGLVAACVTPLMQTWRFPQPKPAPVTFRITLQLAPDDEPATDRDADAKRMADKLAAPPPVKDAPPDVKHNRKSVV